MPKRRKCKYIDSSDDSSDSEAENKPKRSKERSSVAYVTRGLVKDLDDNIEHNTPTKQQKNTKTKEKRLASRVFDSDSDEAVNVNNALRKQADNKVPK